MEQSSRGPVIRWSKQQYQQSQHGYEYIMATLCHPAQSKHCSNIQTSSLWGLNCPAPINTPSTFSDAVNIRDHKINLNHVVNECVDVTNDNHQAAGGVDGLVCVEEPRPAISYTGDTGHQAAHGPLHWSAPAGLLRVGSSLLRHLKCGVLYSRVVASLICSHGNKDHVKCAPIFAHHALCPSKYLEQNV